MVKTIIEPSKEINVIHEADICVLGGSCTGVFAALQAARLGMKVALVEANGFLGGTATAGGVCVWHRMYDLECKKRIISGLTEELMDIMVKRGSAVDLNLRNAGGNVGYRFNPWEMVLELDRLIDHKNIRPFLHTRFCAPVLNDTGDVQAIIIEDKSGRRAIRANFFIDATGDADLIHRMGLETRKDSHLQPPTMCAFITGLDKIGEADPDFNIGQAVFDPKYPEALAPGFCWGSNVKGVPNDTYMVAGTRVHGADCSDADQLTGAEIAARSQVRSICDLLRNNFKGGEDVYLSGLPSALGIRETRHAVCEYTMTEEDVLHGRKFDDGIANSCYPVDIHRADQGGNIFRYLDGREMITKPNHPSTFSRWLPEGEKGSDYYQVPFRSIVPKGSKNVLIAGRSVDADRPAFGGIRVMQVCNQMGEAAGVAATLCLQNNLIPKELAPAKLKETLATLGNNTL